MISKKRIDSIVTQFKKEGVQGDVRGVLEKSGTVGDLIKALQKFNPELPIEIEIPVEFDNETEEMLSEVGFFVDIVETPGETNDSTVITIRGCKPDMLKAYTDWESDDL